MLIQILTQHPEAISSILRSTPNWVWGLATALAALGISQLFARRASLTRVLVMPAAMLAFALYGIVSAFAVPGQSVAVLTGVFAAWMVAAAATLGLLSGLRPPGAARYHADRREFELPGSLVPLLLITGVFLTKYAVGIEVAMQPTLPRDAGFALSIAAVYGAFNGLFAARAAALWRLSRQASPILATA